MLPSIWSGAGITLRPSTTLLGEFPLVFCLNGLEESGSVLLATDHLLEFGRPALGKDRARRVGDEVHRVTANHRSGSERLGRDRARSDGRYRGARRPAGVGAADGHVDLAGRIVCGDPVEEERDAVCVLRSGGDTEGQRPPMAAGDPPASAGGITKNPTFPGMAVS
jgi:hypothetical protein